MKWLQKDKYLMTAVFLAAFLILTACSFFPKRMLVYPDELRYLHIADGIFNYGHLLIRCTEASFTKVMYPLALFPATFFSGTEYYTQAISVMNSFYMALVPVLSVLLARICCLSRLKTLFLLALAFTFPDLLYVITFMSENLYIPLGIGTILLVWKSLEVARDRKKFYLLSAVQGLMFYLLYLNKEIGLAVLLSYVMMGLYIHMRGEGEKLPWRGMIISLSVFGMFFLIVKSIFFVGTGNTYSNQVFFAKAPLWESAIYFAEVCLIHLNRTVFAFFIFPVVIPLSCWKSLDKNTQYRYIFVTLCLLISLAVVSYTVTLYEDYPSLAPREHMRYVSFLFLPYVALFLQCLDLGRNNIKYSCLALMTLAFLGMQAILPAGFNVGAHVDQMMLKYALNHEKARLAVMIGLSVVCFLFYRYERKAVAMLVVLMISVSLVNQVKIYKEFSPVYRISKEVSNAYISMMSDIKDIRKDVVCVVSPTLFDGTLSVDCYPNSISVVSYRVYQDVWSILPEYKGNLTASLFHDIKKTRHVDNPYFNDYTYDKESVRYLLVSQEAEQDLDISRMRFVKTYDTGFTLYENLEPEVIPFLAK